MGGFNSGKKKSDRLKPVVEDFIEINILNFKKDKLLDPGATFTMNYTKNGHEITTVFISVKKESLSLQYKYKEERREQKVFFVRTACNYGNQRTWLKCAQCGSKRNSLYLGPDGIWACRVCHGLVYKIQRLNPHERHLYRSKSIRKKRLNAKTEGIFGVPEKPFGISDKKYIRILEQVIKHEKLSFDLFFDWVEDFKNRADKAL